MDSVGPTVSRLVCYGRGETGCDRRHLPIQADSGYS